jgi:hypothetical protein
MGCCGQNRTIPGKRQTASVPIRNPVSGVRLQEGAPVQSPGSPVATAPLRYLKQSGIVVRGPVTGRQYAFSTAKPVQQVDTRDAPGLLRTSWFRRA